MFNYKFARLACSPFQCYKSTLLVREEKECPVAFFARQLRGAEKNYSATELEALAAGSAVTHFASYLY